MREYKNARLIGQDKSVPRLNIRDVWRSQLRNDRHGVI